MIDEGFRTTHHNLLKLFQFSFVAQATYTFCYDWSIVLFVYHVLIAAVIGRGLSDPRRWGPSTNNASSAASLATPPSPTSNENNHTSNTPKKSRSGNSASTPTSSPLTPSGSHPDYESLLNLRSQEGMYNVRMRIAKTVLCCIIPVLAHVYLFFPSTTTTMSSSTLFSASFARKVTTFSNMFHFMNGGNNNTDYDNYFHHQARENMELQSRLMSSSVLQFAFAVDRCGLLWMLWLDFVKGVLAFAMLSVDCHDHGFCLDLSR